MLEPVADHPQLERVHARQIPEVREAEAGRVGHAIQLGNRPVRKLGVRGPGADHGRELLLGRVRPYRAKRPREPAWREPPLGEQRVDDAVRWQVGVLRPEARQVLAALAVGEPGQIALPLGALGVGQQTRADRREARPVVPLDVPHHADEDEVHREPETVPHREKAAVVGVVEVPEYVLAATREEPLARVPRVPAVHRRLDELAWAHPRALCQRGRGPPGKRVAQAVGERLAGGRGERRELAVQPLGQLEVRHECPELRRRPELEPRRLVHIERSGEVVGLYAELVGGAPRLVEEEAVHDARRVARPEQAWRGEPRFADERGVGQPLEDPGHRVLCDAVDRRVGVDVHPVEVVQPVGAHQPQQTRAERVGRLAVGERGRGKRRSDRGEGEAGVAGRTEQPPIDGALVREQPEVQIDELVERLPPRLRRQVV